MFFGSKFRVLGNQHLMLAYICNEDGFVKLTVDLTYDIQRTHKLSVFHSQRMFFLPALDLIQPFLGVLLGYIFRHFCDRFFGVGYNGNIHLDISGNRSCINVYMDDLGIGSESVELSGNAVVKSGPDGKQYIAVAYCHIGGISSVHSQISHKQGVIGRNGSTAHNSSYYRHLGLFYYLSKDFSCSGNVYSAACQKQRTFCFFKNLDSLFQLADMNAGVRLIPSDVDGFGIFRTSQFTHYVFWQVHQYRSGPSCAGDIKGLFDDTSQILTPSYSNPVFGNASGDADDIHLLECVISDQISGYLAGKAYKRHTVIVGCSKAGDYIGRTWAAGNKTYSDLSCGPCVGVCFMDQRLLMTGKDNVDIILFI